MPPHVPRKRLRSPSPDNDNRRQANSKAKTKSLAAVAPSPRKSTLFNDLDAGSKTRSAEKTKLALQKMHDDDDESSLSSLSDAEFEDVNPAKRQKLDASEESDEDDDDDDDIEFEDVHHQPQQDAADPVPSGDLELTLYQYNTPQPTNIGKKGPSKREKAIRNATHRSHVQFLLWHNALRNSWLCDQEVQAIMISHLPPRLWEEVDRWRLSTGLDDHEKATSKEDTRGKGKGKSRVKASSAKPARDWSDAAERLEKGVPDMSHGDPLFRLIRSLTAWWKQRFRITAPGLRKIGYMGVRRLAKLTIGFETEEHDPEIYGERIENLEKFRWHAQVCEGSRDVGAQLFVALLRGLGLEARLVANLQPVGFGFSKSEDAEDEDTARKKSGDETEKPSASAAKKPLKQPKNRVPVRPATRRTRKSDKDALRMDLDESDEFAEPLSDDSDDSVVDVTSEHSKSTKERKSFDKDLEFPHYWTEVLSPATQKYLPVDPIVKSVIGINRDLIESLEPRGSKADKAKQVMTYVVGFSQDGTAKDVTVRYLRKQLYPGRTKGVRVPVEKVPIYNKHGKIKCHEMFDWFKSVMRGYVRGDKKHPITEVDELEDSTDLKPAVPEKKEVKEGEETLQYYKTSKEYVLERHLKREEALLPDAVPVKVFRNKGRGGKVDEEDVYLRKDVVAVKSAETWHKQGRAPIDGAQPLKQAPYRAATTNRRREIAEAEARTGQKVLQPLYSLEQTDWIIPEPIKDGVIPKNEYGNIDMFAEHMCPEGAVHIPYRGVVRVCKRLEIDFAEAVVGFEFGHRMAVPVIQGVVIAEEHQERVLEELEKDEAERARKEDEKRRKAVLTTWRKLLMGLRIANRLQADYGHMDQVDPFKHQQGVNKNGKHGTGEDDEDVAGGFLPEGYEDDEEAGDEPRRTSTYFPTHNSDDDDEDADGGFIVEDGVAGNSEALTSAAGSGGDPEEEKEQEDDNEEEEEDQEFRPPPKRRVRVAKRKAKAKPKPSTRRRSGRRRVESSDDDEEEDEDSPLSDLSDSDG